MTGAAAAPGAGSERQDVRVVIQKLVSLTSALLPGSAWIDE